MAVIVRAARQVLFAVLLCSHAGPALSQVILRDLPAPVDGGSRIREVMFPGNGMGFAGLSTLDPAGPVILYDSVWIDRIGGLDSPGFRFTRAHEYGHHRLRHVLVQFTTPPAALPVLSHRSELEADCWAVRKLEENDDEAAIRAGMRIYQRVLPEESTPDGRPGSLERIRIMRHCQGSSRVLDSEEKPNHAHRLAVGRTCATPLGSCGPLYGIAALPIGSPCHCGAIGGRVTNP